MGTLEEELEKIYDNPDIAVDGPSEKAEELGRLVAHLQH